MLHNNSNARVEGGARNVLRNSFVTYCISRYNYAYLLYTWREIHSASSQIHELDHTHLPAIYV